MLPSRKDVVVQGQSPEGEGQTLEFPLAQPCPSVPLPPPPASPSVTCSPRRAWWMVRLRLLCMVNKMALPVWLNRGAPATYTHPCLEDTTDVTVYPAAGGNRLVSGPTSSAGLARGPEPAELCLRPGQGVVQGRPCRCESLRQ